MAKDQIKILGTVDYSKPCDYCDVRLVIGHRMIIGTSLVEVCTNCKHKILGKGDDEINQSNDPREVRAIR
jgi:DNA-directed RNA polymerase subunit RPC12/RpoP